MKGLNFFHYSSPLARRLLRTVLSIYLVVAISLTAIQMFLEYVNEEKRLHQQINQMAVTFTPILAQAMWDFNDEQLQATMSGLLESYEILGIRIVDVDGDTTELGAVSRNAAGSESDGPEIPLKKMDQENPTSFYIEDNFLLFSFDIEFQRSDGSSSAVGSATLFSSRSIIVDKVTYTLINTFVSACIKTLFLWMIFQFILTRVVARPLEDLSRLMQNFNPEDSVVEKPLLSDVPNFNAIDQPSAARDRLSKDELELLESSFLDMQSHIVQQRQALISHQNNLEQSVADRTRELHQTNEKLVSANRAKSRFLASISHEIRTPLNGVIGMTDILAEGYLDEKQQTSIDLIRSSSRLLLGIINDVLDYSKIEAGKLEVESIRYNIRETVGDICTLFGSQANENIKLIRRVQDDVPEWLMGDSMRMRQVLINLLSNAYKFTERGMIELQLERVSEGHNVLLLLRVVDTGIGMSSEQRAHVFDSFTQADSSTSRRYGGTGLGLAISRQLVELMGGRIEAHSKLNEGSTFSFTVPLIEATPEQAIEVEKIDSDHTLPDLNKLKVLVAEDNPTNVLVIKGLLQLFSIHPDIVNNGHEAIIAHKKHQNMPYDITFMDCDMPVLDGFEATQAIRELERENGNRSKIVALSAHAMDENMQQSADAGMDGHLSKPITKVVLKKFFLGFLAEKNSGT